MTHWLLFAIFLSRPGGVTETYLDKASCVAALQEFKFIARSDFYAGSCSNSEDETDYVEIATELSP